MSTDHVRLEFKSRAHRFWKLTLLNASFSTHIYEERGWEVGVGGQVHYMLRISVPLPSVI